MDVVEFVMFMIQSMFMQTATGGENVWYLYILPFVVPGVTALIFLVKNQGKTDAKGEMADFEIAGLKDGMKDVKSDIKDLHEKSEDALRNIDLLNLRIQNIERYHDRKGAV